MDAETGRQALRTRRSCSSAVTGACAGRKRGGRAVRRGSLSARIALSVCPMDEIGKRQAADRLGG